MGKSLLALTLLAAALTAAPPPAPAGDDPIIVHSIRPRAAKTS